MSTSTSSSATAFEKRPKVLCVDDEPQVLEALALHLERRYDLTVATSGAAALALLEDSTFTVILSDMRMPSMDGATFLARARRITPDSVRMLLTGEADLAAAIAAVNEGQIFRFLTKPCPPPRLLSAFQNAIEQHRLVTAERVLLEETLHGSIKLLTDVLALAAPQSFGRASRLKDLAAELSGSIAANPIWEIEVAAMLSRLGCVALPQSTVDKLDGGFPLSDAEQLAVAGLPTLADGLLANIPRLEGIRACLMNQTKRFDGSDSPANSVREHAIPLGARVLKIVTDFDELQSRGMPTGVALDTMCNRSGWYDPALLEVFGRQRGRDAEAVRVRELPLKLVHPGMVFAEDLKTAAGVLLLRRGFEVTESLLERIRNLQVQGNVKIIVKSGTDAA